MNVLTVLGLLNMVGFEWDASIKSILSLGTILNINTEIFQVCLKIPDWNLQLAPAVLVRNKQTRKGFLFAVYLCVPEQGNPVRTILISSSFYVCTFDNTFAVLGYLWATLRCCDRDPGSFNFLNRWIIKKSVTVWWNTRRCAYLYKSNDAPPPDNVMNPYCDERCCLCSPVQNPVSFV